MSSNSRTAISPNLSAISLRVIALAGRNKSRMGAAVFAECVEVGVQCFEVDQSISYGVGYDDFARV